MAGGTEASPERMRRDPPTACSRGACVRLYRVATQDPFIWIVLFARIWHKSRVVNEYGLSSDDTGDERIGRLRDEVERLREELSRRERENDRQKRQIDGLRRQDERQKREIEHLRRQLAAARRAGFRQAAPFAKDRPQGCGRRPGRRAGAQYGRKACRPRPARVDQTLEAPVPTACPDCGGSVEVAQVASQYQEEIPEVRPIVRRFDIEVGRCSQCRRRVQGRHPLQTSDALGAAGAQLGPGVVALVVELHTEMGVPLAKVAHVLRTTFGLHVTPGGLAHLLHRTARDAAPTYTALCEQVRNSPAVTPDETGWRVGAINHWLWAFVTPETTVYAICPGRGFDDATTVLGADFAGVLVRDGWVSYRCYREALHQSCLNHLLRRCKELQEDHPDSLWAGQVQAVLQTGLAVRNRCNDGELSEHGLASIRGRLVARLGRLIDAPPPPDDAERFARHLATEFAAVFLFLWDLSIDATNWRAEQAIRPAVVIRKDAPICQERVGTPPRAELDLKWSGQKAHGRRRGISRGRTRVGDPDRRCRLPSSPAFVQRQVVRAAER